MLNIRTPLRTSFELVWGGLRNYYISDPVVGRVLLATMPGEISCPLDGEKEKDQIAPALLLLKWVSKTLVLLVVIATNLMNRPHGMTLLVNKGNLRDQVRSWDIRVV